MVLQILDLPAERKLKHWQFVHKTTLIFSKTQLCYFSSWEVKRVIIGILFLRVPLYTTPLHKIYLCSIGSCCATPHPPPFLLEITIADRDSCCYWCWEKSLKMEDKAAFYKTIYFVIFLAHFWRLQILFFTFLNADILSCRNKKTIRFWKDSFLLLEHMKQKILWAFRKLVIQ